MKRYRVLILLLVGLTIVGFFISGTHDALTLGMLKDQQARFQAWFERSPWIVAGGYFLLYVVITGMGLPGAALLTLLGGALFGLAWGLPLISFASAIGATLAFLLSRTLFRESVERHFRRYLEAINRGMEREGALYLFSLRLVPIFPFFVVNLIMGVTSLKLRTFYLVSQAGMLPATVVYVNAGQQLGELDSVSGVFSLDLLLSFTLLGLLPLAAKKGTDALHRHKA